MSCKEGDAGCVHDLVLLEQMSASNLRLAVEIESNIFDKKRIYDITPTTTEELIRVQENVEKALSYRNAIWESSVKSQVLLHDRELIAEYVFNLNSLLQEDFADSSSFSYFKFRYDETVKNQYSAMILTLLFEKEYLRLQEKKIYELVIYDTHH
jgi:hypothetical protein